MENNFNPIEGVDSDIPIWVQGTDKSHTINKEKMYKNLLDFKESCDKYELEFVIIFGALLGLIREGDLIDGDDDIDVACFTEVSKWRDYYKFGYVINDMVKKGYYVPSRNFCPWHDVSFIRDGQKIEIWMFSKIDNERIYDNIVRYPTKYFYTLEEIEFLGKKFKIPSNPKSFLEYTYGCKFMIPNPNGSYTLARHRNKK